MLKARNHHQNMQLKNADGTILGIYDKPLDKEINSASLRFSITQLFTSIIGVLQLQPSGIEVTGIYRGIQFSLNASDAEENHTGNRLRVWEPACILPVSSRRP